MTSNIKLRHLNFAKELSIAHNFFIDKGFEVKVIDSDNFIATKKGKIFIFFKYIDFYFVKINKSVKINTLEDFHIDSIFKANKKNKMPKILRTTIPNINTINITNSEPQKNVIEYISRRRLNPLGGQQESLFVISLLS